ncbi:HTH-type transcriptional repressor Bm3R1 [Anatilimnocola aggregata]|uniref:HTH-type transcriptional repressor Bm3R1 n=1 Tax=Anatilimnocola aggregata TaxID=2528021 RepID=A0A517YHS7_9BACT|nr:TetR/AcrR family transcriptional regulator [Anatilimnocola aggregata]QDU29771.1 HTH-type transcriptional repressor Bm3R1 [Anatilimnocola aggregata]
MASGSFEHEKTPNESGFDSLSERDREILLAATRLFAREGYAQTDVQEIADAAGIGKGTVYRTFGNKENLFLAAVRFARARVLDEVDAAAALATEPLDHWRRGMQAFLHFFDENPAVVELLIEERALSRGRRVATFFDTQGKGSERWRQVFRQLIDAGVIRQLPVEQVEQAISRYLFGTLFVSYFVGRPEPLAPQFESLFDILFTGLANRA